MRNNKFWKKSFISLFLSLAMAVSFVGNVVLSTVYAVDFGFQEIRGETSKWPKDIPGRENDFSNTLSMNFEAAKVNNSYMKAGVWFNYENLENYRERIVNFPNDKYSDMGYLVEGWIWNTNIGWISTSCKDWEKYDKTFAGWCKNFSPYQVYMTSPKNDEAYLRGYAWSPKVGWLLFHYADENEGKPVVYKGTDVWVKNVPKINIKDDKKSGTLSGYAWNDKIGYFSLNKATIDFTGMNTCIDPYLEFSEGYDFAVCPKANDTYEYKSSATLKCKLGNPMPRYTYSRNDLKEDPLDPPDSFKIFDSGKMEWTLTDKTFSGCGTITKETVAQIKVSNKDVFSEAGQEIVEDIKIKLLESCKVKFDESVFDFYDINDNEVLEDVYKDAYVNSEYYYKIKISDTDWTSPINYTLVKAPTGMTLEKADDNTVILRWTPVTGDLGQSYDISIKAKNCNPAGLVRTYKVKVQGKAPSTLTSCPSYWFVGEAYSCEAIVDLNEADKASTPLDWSITESSSNDISGWDEGGLKVVFYNLTTSYKSSLRDTKLKLVNSSNQLINATNGMKDNTFTLKYEVKNDFTKSEPIKKEINVTVTDKEVAPVFSYTDEALTMMDFNLSENIYREYMLDEGGPSGSLVWSAIQSGGNGTISVNTINTLNTKGKMTYSFNTLNDEGKIISIETKVENNKMDPVTSATVKINKLIGGYSPKINKTLVEDSLKYKFIKGETSNFDLKNLTRLGDDFKNKLNTDSALPISGTTISNETGLYGFKWMILGSNVGNIDKDTGVWNWTPNRSGKVTLKLRVNNFFGSNEQELEIEVGETPKFQENPLNLSCIEGNVINKDIVITNAYPEFIESWEISNVDSNLEANKNPKDDGNGVITVFDNKPEYTLKLSYVKTPGLSKDTWTANLNWTCAVESTVQDLTFNITAQNGAGSATLPVTIGVTPKGDVAAVSDIILDDFIVIKVDENKMIRTEAAGGVPVYTWTATLYYKNSDGTWDIYKPVKFFPKPPLTTLITPNSIGVLGFTPSLDDLNFQNNQTFESDKVFRLDVTVTDGNGYAFNLLSQKHNNDHSKLPKVKIVPVSSDTPELWSEKLAQNFGGTVSIRKELFGGTSTSIGNPETNISRDAIFGNVLALKRGIPENSNSSVNGKIILNGDKLTKSDVVGVEIDNEKVLLYENVDVKIDDPNKDTLDWDGHQTIIVYGGNLLINDNLWPSGTNNGTLDIVVLRKSGDTRGKSGNILVDNDVTNIKANIYADGALFSYDADDFDRNNLIANGYPDYMSKKCMPEEGKYSEYMNCMDGDASETRLKNQFKLLGSLNSKNTVGKVKQSGLDSAKFDVSDLKNGYGEAASLAEALAYDLVYFRFYHLNYESGCDTGEAKNFSGNCMAIANLKVTDQKVCRGISEKSVYVDTGNVCKEKASSTSNENDAVIIEYLPYSAESKVFKMSGEY